MAKSKEDSFHLGVKALIRNPCKEILLLERNHKKSDIIYWDLPGGRIQKGESLLDALRREVKEEVGLDDIDRIEPFITVLTDIRIQASQEDVGLIFSIHLCDINYPFSPQLSDEHISFKWFSVYECLQRLKRYPAEFTEKLVDLR